MSRVTISLKKLLVTAVLFGLLVAACGPLSAGSQQPTESAATARTGQSDLHVEVVGLLEALGDDTATVGGMRLKLTANTLLEGDLAPNQLVEAQSVLGSEGLTALIVRQAGPARTAGQTFELTGVLESQAGETWTVGGHTVRVNAGQTEVAAGLTVGVLVKVQGTSSQAGDLLAREVQAISPAAATAGAEIEFNGVVTSIGANTWVIGARTVQVTPQTEIKAGVALGALVKVHALPQANGTLVAREIEVTTAATATASATGTSQPRPGNEQEFTGTLTAINGDVWTIGGRAVRITASTEVKGTLQIGDRLKVHASPGTDGVLVAREVELAVGDDDNGGRAGEQEFTGELTARQGDLWTIGGRQVRIAGSTEVKGNLQIGDLVKVHATPGTDGILVAREVEPANGADDDNSGSGNGGGDDNSGPGNSGGDDDRSDDNSGPGSSDDDNDDDNSGSGNSDDDNDDDNSGSGHGDDDDDDDNSGSGSGGSDDDNDDNSGSGGGGSDDD